MAGWEFFQATAATAEIAATMPRAFSHRVEVERFAEFIDKPSVLVIICSIDIAEQVIVVLPPKVVLLVRLGAKLLKPQPERRSNVNVISAMSLPDSVRPLLPSLDLLDEQNINPAQVAFVPPSDLLCEDCNPVWENGIAA